MSRLHVLTLLVTAAACKNADTSNVEQGRQEEPAGEPAAEVAAPEAPEAAQTSPDLIIIEVLRTPADWVGKTVSGNARVVEVPTDRGFWIEAGGQRIFAILIDGPEEDPIDINVGQSLRIDQATVHDATTLDGIEGEPLEEETKSLARSQAVYLVVNEADITITSPSVAPM